jgi:hypothetical protein
MNGIYILCLLALEKDEGAFGVSFALFSQLCHLYFTIGLLEGGDVLELRVHDYADIFIVI